MINNQITITHSQIGAYIEKNEGEVKLENKKLHKENRILKDRIKELEKEILILKDRCN
ncbi:MAG: hypothetical protein N4A71_21880 [Carboxylicivirga sp.]|jgi:cell division protein FtsB|nr:hypothetical protein [Carboxylicivirga sp.]